MRSLTTDETGALRSIYEWVSADSQHPSQSGEYLVLLRNEKFKLMRYEKENATFIPKAMNGIVTHWTRLPSTSVLCK